MGRVLRREVCQRRVAVSYTGCDGVTRLEMGQLGCAGIGEVVVWLEKWRVGRVGRGGCLAVADNTRKWGNTRQTRIHSEEKAAKYCGLCVCRQAGGTEREHGLAVSYSYEPCFFHSLESVAITT